MTELQVVSASASGATAAGLVVGVFAGADEPELAPHRSLSTELVAVLDGLLAPLAISGEAGTVIRVPGVDGLSPRVIILVGLGAPALASERTEQLRQAAGVAVRHAFGLESIALALPAGNNAEVSAIAEGALLGAYRFDRYRTAPSPEGAPPDTVTVLVAGERQGRDLVPRVVAVAAAVSATRDLVNTSPLHLYPETMASYAVDAVAGLPIDITILDESHLVEGGYGGLVGVGQGSSRPPRLVRVDYSPPGASSHLALVGKGISFDSGGLSLKPVAGMETMKLDMSGAAAVLHTAIAAARLALPIRVTAWLALAENLPSGTAQRPGDVITIRGGTTVEVLNTDAEGRLVLADAISAAGEDNPDVIVDIATLTGAQMVALGTRISGLMSNDSGLRDRIHRIGEEVGEACWPMPLPSQLRKGLNSKIADLGNMGERWGGMLTAGVFLSEFVPVSGADAGATPWAHLDICGPAFNTGEAHGYTPSGGTGAGVRVLLRLAEELSTTASAT